MSKTLTNVLIGAVEIGVSFLPFVGPAAATALRIAGALTEVGVAANIIFAGNQSHQPPETTSTAIKSPISSRVSCYGRSRPTGAYFL